jgi:hypothetical protein
MIPVFAPAKKNKITPTVKLKIYFPCSCGSEALIKNCFRKLSSNT